MAAGRTCVRLGGGLSGVRLGGYTACSVSSRSEIR